MLPSQAMNTGLSEVTGQDVAMSVVSLRFAVFEVASRRDFYGDYSMRTQAFSFVL
jgi:hypothetical protein